VFGIIKSVMGFRQFLLRGLDCVRGEWSLVTTAWNIIHQGLCGDLLSARRANTTIENRATTGRADRAPARLSSGEHLGLVSSL
jgi:hypothetical protein